MDIRILLADDHKLMREGLRTLISEQPGMSIVAEAEDGGSAVELAIRLSPDIIIMDISMPGLNGIEATRRILASGSGSKIIALSMHLEKRMVLEMLDAGVSGYLLKDCAFDEVIQAIRSVATNCAYLSPKIAVIVIREFMRRIPRDEFSSWPDLTAKEREMVQLLAEGKEMEEVSSQLQLSVKTAEALREQVIFQHIAPFLYRITNESKAAPPLSLTSREKEILVWIKEGKSTWDIASILGVTQDTVKFHLKNIFQKLNATSRSQAIAVALAHKLIDL